MRAHTHTHTHTHEPAQEFPSFVMLPLMLLSLGSESACEPARAKNVCAEWDADMQELV